MLYAPTFCLCYLFAVSFKDAVGRLSEVVDRQITGRQVNNELKKIVEGIGCSTVTIVISEFRLARLRITTKTPHFAIAGVPAQMRTALRWDDIHRRRIVNKLYPSFWYFELQFLYTYFFPQPFFFTQGQVIKDHKGNRCIALSFL